MKRSIAFIGQIMEPRLSKVLILFDSGRTSEVSMLEVFNGNRSIVTSGIQMDIKLIKTLNEWKQAVLNSRKEGYEALVIGLFHTITVLDKVIHQLFIMDI